MSHDKGAIARFDSTGHFEIVDEQLITELGPQDIALVSGGATRTDATCGNNVGCGTDQVCLSVGPNINGFCREGALDVVCHGNHTLNIVC